METIANSGSKWVDRASTISNLELLRKLHIYFNLIEDNEIGYIYFDIWVDLLHNYIRSPYWLPIGEQKMNELETYVMNLVSLHSNYSSERYNCFAQRRYKDETVASPSYSSLSYSKFKKEFMNFSNGKVRLMLVTIVNAIEEREIKLK
jgi:hypothetical protein